MKSMFNIEHVSVLPVTVNNTESEWGNITYYSWSTVGTRSIIGILYTVIVLNFRAMQLTVLSENKYDIKRDF